MKSLNISFSSLGNIIAVADGQEWNRADTPQIILYDLEGGKIKFHIFSKGNTISEFKLTDDGKYLVVCCENKFLNIYDTNSGKILRTITGPIDPPISIFNNGKSILATMKGIGFGIWDLENGSIITQSPGLQNVYNTINRIGIFPDGRCIVFSRSYNEVYFWDINSNQNFIPLTAHCDYIEDIRSNKVNKLSASLSGDGKVYLWEAETSKNLYSLNVAGLKISNISFSHNGKYIASVAFSIDFGHIDSVNVSLWDAHNGNLIKEYIVDSIKTSPNKIGFSKDDKYLLLINDNRLLTYDIDTGEKLKRSAAVVYGSLSPQSKYIVPEFLQNDLEIWDIENDTTQLYPNSHKGFIRTVSFSDDEKILVTSGEDDNLLNVWELPQLKLRNKFLINIPQMQYGSVSPCGRYFAGGSRNGNVNIWEFNTGKIIQTFSEYPCFVNSIGWSPDSKLVFSGYFDGTIIALHNKSVE